MFDEEDGIDEEGEDASVDCIGEDGRWYRALSYEIVFISSQTVEVGDWILGEEPSDRLDWRDYRSRDDLKMTLKEQMLASSIDMPKVCM